MLASTTRSAMRRGPFQKRSISLLHKMTTTNYDKDLDHAMQRVSKFDPAGYLPGRLLPDPQMQVAYYAVRSFWVETGLTPTRENVEWWQTAVDALYGEDNEVVVDAHPTLRLLQSVMENGTEWNKCHFDDILEGRRKDLDVKQYETLDELVHHAEQSCGSLSQMVLESGGVMRPSAAHEAARLVGIGHGLTNALRTSIPVMSHTGRLIVPAELTQKYGVRSPRYLLSALGLGDEACLQALQNAVRDIATTAQEHLEQARELRETILSEPNGTKALPVLLPGLASEAFLRRLERSNHRLTDQNLRSVGAIEHSVCAARMILAYYQQKY